MAGKLHRVQRPDLEAEPLQRESRRRIADMAEDDVGLDREDRARHGASHSNSPTPVKALRARGLPAPCAFARQKKTDRRRAGKKFALPEIRRPNIFDWLGLDDDGLAEPFDVPHAFTP